MVQQPVQDRRGDNRIAEDRAPVAIAFVRGQDNAAAFVTRADQLKEDGWYPFDQPRSGASGFPIGRVIQGRGQIERFGQRYKSDAETCDMYDHLGFASV